MQESTEEDGKKTAASPPLPTSMGYQQQQQGYPPPAASPPVAYPPLPAANYPPLPPANYPPAPPVGFQQGGYPVAAPGGGYPAAPGGFQPSPGYAYQAPLPIMQQPAPTGGAINWMQAPSAGPNCPPGLEYLTMIDQLLVHQKVEVLEIITGYETENRYSVLNSMGQHVYEAKEKSSFCGRQCCGPNRSFDMKVYDNFNNMVIHLHRPFVCCACCCFPCIHQSIEVTAPPGTLVGSVVQQWSLFKPKFEIKDAEGNVVLVIRGPCMACRCCSDVEFKILTADGSKQVGVISKQWGGFVQEQFTDADKFGISFPMDLDVKMKAVMLGACFLIDFLYFEEAAGQDKNRNSD